MSREHSGISRSRTALLLALCVGIMRPVLAQEAVNRASLSGRVIDLRGDGVAGAHVSARQTQTNIVAESIADQEGHFRFPFLSIGPYEITARHADFGEAKRPVTLTVGSAFDLAIVLSPAFEAEVTVSSAAPILETVRSQVAATVTHLEASTLPLNGSNFLDVAFLAPGVAPANVGSTQLFSETSAVPGQGLSIGSQRNFSNSFIVDGLSANDDAAGLSGMPYSIDAIDQFQVVTSGGQAEFGRALGGYVNIVTKSGSNTTTGNVYGQFRDRALNAGNPLSGTRLPMDQELYGASAGGPLRRNRTFYFSSFEQKRLDQTGLVTIPADTARTINARLAEVGYPGVGVSTGIYPNPVRATNVLGKLDHMVSGSDQLSIRFSLYDVTARNSRGAGELNAVSSAADLENRDDSFGVSNVLTLSHQTVNETRVQIARGDLQAPPTDPVGPAVSIAGVAAFGTLAGSPTQRVNGMIEFVDSMSHQAGAHALRAGTNVLFNDDRVTFPRSFRGAYTFSSLANFLSGAYNNAGFTQTFGIPDVRQTNPNVALYAQDEWRVAPGATLHAGIRYDLQMIDTIDTDRDNISPRVGVAWTPRGQPGTVVRGSVGVFRDRVPLRAVANALLSAENTTDLDSLRQMSVTLSPAQAGAPAFPQILNAPVPLVTLVNFTTMDKDIQNASATQSSIEVERALGGVGSYSVGYQMVRARNLLIPLNRNAPSCVAAGANNGCRPNPGYANHFEYTSAARSDYQGLHATLIGRPSRRGSYRVSYTLSKAMTNVGENLFSPPIDPLDVEKDWGRSNADQRHRIVATGSIETSREPGHSNLQWLTDGFQVSGMWQWYSAAPLDISSGVTTVQGTTGRPVVNGEFIPRNSGDADDFFSVSVRISRAFVLRRSLRMEAILDAFNVTNRQNDLARNGNFGPGAYPTNPAPFFNRTTAVGEPRAVQLGVRLRF